MSYISTSPTLESLRYSYCCRKSLFWDITVVLKLISWLSLCSWLWSLLMGRRRLAREIKSNPFFLEKIGSQNFSFQICRAKARASKKWGGKHMKIPHTDLYKRIIINPHLMDMSTQPYHQIYHVLSTISSWRGRKEMCQREILLVIICSNMKINPRSSKITWTSKGFAKWMRKRAQGARSRVRVDSFYPLLMDHLYVQLRLGWRS